MTLYALARPPVSTAKAFKLEACSPRIPPLRGGRTSKHQILAAARDPRGSPDDLEAIKLVPRQRGADFHVPILPLAALGAVLLASQCLKGVGGRVDSAGDGAVSTLSKIRLVSTVLISSRAPSTLPSLLNLLMMSST